MKFTIVTGLSGAGRSSALKRLEDLGYFCVDNLFPQLIPQFAQICSNKHGKVAAAVDTRMGVDFESIYNAIDELKSYKIEVDILFLDASDEVLIKRFKEVRRLHPVSNSGEIVKSVQKERELLERIKEMSDHIIDTTSYNMLKFKKIMDTIYSDDEDKRMIVSVTSFGFKRGIPIDADIVFDARFVTNPFYVPNLKHLTGKDKAVSDFVLAFDVTQNFLNSFEQTIKELIPHYYDEDKKQLVIAIGCTGGQHRSVAIAEELYKRLSNSNMRVNIDHRDIALELQR